MAQKNELPARRTMASACAAEAAFPGALRASLVVFICITDTGYTRHPAASRAVAASLPGATAAAPMTKRRADGHAGEKQRRHGQ